ncbi:DinB family protein [Algoriphagus vanfongensis]|uniref:DinB family protein n=1 Tax=Algoriphagus vanfongensis TaxID=426371 RepID=UPI0003FADD06|nr:DinB family protein [Algoriphagus vanfongensis]
MIESLIEVFVRDLNRLKTELETFQHEENLWKTEGAISNSAGNLALHLIGNLRAFICHEMGGFAYVRDREFEFGGKGVAREKMLEEIHLVITQVKSSLEGLSGANLDEVYPHEKFGKPMTYSFFLIHLYGHFDYHLGQINYLRRVLEPA